MIRKMKQVLAALLAASLMAGCSSRASTAETEAVTTKAVETEAAETEVETTAAESQEEESEKSGWIVSSLKENVTKDMEVDEQDDFYLAVNQSWIVETEVPEGRSYSNVFLQLEENVMEQCRQVIADESLKGHDADLVKGLYHSYMDWEARNVRGVEPMMPRVEAIQSIGNMDELTKFICDAKASLGVPTLMWVGNMEDFNHAQAYITAVDNTNLLLDDSGEYEERSEYGELLYEAIGGGVVTMLQRAGYTKEEAEKVYETALEFEEKLAGSIYTSKEKNSPDYLARINNVMSLKELTALAPNVPIKEFIQSQGYAAAKEYMVLNPEYIALLNDVYSEENLEGIKAYMLSHYVLGEMTYLDREAFELSIQVTNDINGSSGMLADDHYAIEEIKGSLGDPFERLFFEKYDSSKTKERITELCYDIIECYEGILEENEWLSEETRQAAIDKLNHIQVNAVYPEKRIDYSELSIEGMPYYEAVETIAEFSHNLDVENTNQKMDPELWNFSTLDSNAYYMPTNNSVNILYGILGESMYTDAMSDEELYAGIGMVIGHEISHAFDTTGSQFDSEGNMKNWWKEEDFENFSKRAEKLMDYYDSIEVFDDLYVDGEGVSGEAIADLTGVECMLKIGSSHPNFDYDKFFLHYALNWRTIESYEYVYMRLLQDPHPLNYLRVNSIVQQFDEFLETYDVQEGDGMYLAPEDRILVW